MPHWRVKAEPSVKIANLILCVVAATVAALVDASMLWYFAVGNTSKKRTTPRQSWGRAGGADSYGMRTVVFALWCGLLQT